MTTLDSASIPQIISPYATGAPATADEIANSLRNISALGPYFTLTAASLHHGWSVATIPTYAINDRGDHVATQIRVSELRVGASTWHLGTSARVWSALIGTWVHQGIIIDPQALLIADDVDSLALGFDPDRPPAGRYTNPGVQGPHSDAATVVTLATAAFSSLNSIVAEATGVAMGLLWGNVASSALATARLVARSETSWNHDEFLGYLAAHPNLAGTMATDDQGRAVRRSCCLYYRVPGGGLCGDCPLSANRD